MANISDLILQQVTSAAGNLQIPSNVKDQVLGGLSSSILGSLTQTATKAGGIEQITSLLTGKTDAAKSPVTALAGNLFNTNVLSKLNLGTLGASLSGLIPTVMTKLSGIIKDQDGDGDVDLNDILITLKGGNKSSGSGLLGGLAGNLAGNVLGGLFGKK